MAFANARPSKAGAQIVGRFHISPAKYIHLCFLLNPALVEIALMYVGATWVRPHFIRIRPPTQQGLSTCNR
jgi:hypothetical protein